jgi:hypothetical protein
MASAKPLPTWSRPASSRRSTVPSSAAVLAAHWFDGAALARVQEFIALSLRVPLSGDIGRL